MAVSTNSDFLDFIHPLKERLKLYDPAQPPTLQAKNDAADPARAIPQGFIDAMIVRHAVFVEEQGVPLEHELDDDDPRSFHWTAYASVPVKRSSPNLAAQDEKMDNGNRRKSNTSTKVPIGTIRLIPPPHPPHPNGKEYTDVQRPDEHYVKLGRLAVIKEFRKAGISKLLIETALNYIRSRSEEILPHMDAGLMEQMKAQGTSIDFKGLVLVHAQTGVQKVWRKHGFDVDASMGSWMEEGIEHVGMWRRLELASNRRKSRPSIASSP